MRSGWKDCVAAAGARGLVAGRVSGFSRTQLRAAANDLNRIFRVSDAGWRRAPQFDAGFSETVLHLGITPVCFGIAKSIPRFFRRSPSGKAR